MSNQKQYSDVPEISLEPISIDDADFVYQLMNNPQLMEIFCESSTALNKWQDAIRLWAKDLDEENYIITMKSNNLRIGWVGINGLCSKDSTGWIKMIALLPEYWKKGYGSTAIQLVKSLLAEKGYLKVRLWTDKCNERSKACYSRNGFEVVMEKQSAVGSHNVVKDRVMMECCVCEIGMQIDEKICLSEYSDEWTEQFKIEKNIILNRLPNLPIEHIGSTSVVGMISKPIIDIMVGVDVYPPSQEIIEIIEQLGYFNFGENDKANGRLYFAKRGTYNFNLHVVRYLGVLWKNNILFRDYLRTHNESVIAYSMKKKEIVNRGVDRLLQYSNEKSDFITSIINQLNKRLN